MFIRFVTQAVLIILLSSCAKPSSPWKRQDMKKALKSIYSTRIFYTPPCPFAEVGLSFVWDPCGHKAYLFLLCGSFDQSCRKQRVDFAYAIDNVVYTSQAVLMKGGQVAEIDTESAHRIFEALYHKKIVVIQSGAYQSIIPPCDFPELFADKFGIKNCVPKIFHQVLPIS